MSLGAWNECEAAAVYANLLLHELIDRLTKHLKEEDSTLPSSPASTDGMSVGESRRASGVECSSCSRHFSLLGGRFKVVSGPRLSNPPTVGD